VIVTREGGTTGIGFAIPTRSVEAVLTRLAATAIPPAPRLPRHGGDY